MIMIQNKQSLDGANLPGSEDFTLGNVSTSFVRTVVVVVDGVVLISGNGT